jgi:hypothetical protein
MYTDPKRKAKAIFLFLAGKTKLVTGRSPARTGELAKRQNGGHPAQNKQEIGPGINNLVPFPTMMSLVPWNYW